jgi:hypothetical protein
LAASAPSPTFPLNPPYQKTNGGTFSSVLQVNLEPGQDLYVGGSSATAHTYNLTPWAGTQTNPTRYVKAGSGAVFRGSMYRLVVIDAADADVLWEVGPQGAFDGAASFRLSVATNAVITDPSGSQTITLPSTTFFEVKDASGAALWKATDGSPSTLQTSVGLQVYAGTASGAVTLLSAFSGNTGIITDDGSSLTTFTGPHTAVVLEGSTGYYIRINPGAIDTNCKFSSYNAISTAGLGVEPVYAITLSSAPIQLGTGSTGILDVAPPGGSGMYEVTVGGLSIAPSQTITIQVTYESIATSASATQSWSSASLASGHGDSHTFFIDAETGTNIDITGTTSTNLDAYAWAVIKQAGT